MNTPPLRDVRFCACGRPAFLYSDGAYRCLVGHEVPEPLDEEPKRGDAA